MPRGRTGGGRGIEKPVSHSQPAVRIRTPLRMRGNEIGGLNLVQLRMTQFQSAGPPDQAQAGPPAHIQPGPQAQVNQELCDPTQQRQVVDLPEPMEVNDNRVRGRQIEGEQMDLSIRVDPVVPGPLCQVRLVGN